MGVNLDGFEDVENGAWVGWSFLLQHLSPKKFVCAQHHKVVISFCGM